jgi:hypothetical protein
MLTGVLEPYFPDGIPDHVSSVVRDLEESKKETLIHKRNWHNAHAIGLSEFYSAIDTNNHIRWNIRCGLSKRNDDSEAHNHSAHTEQTLLDEI